VSRCIHEPLDAEHRNFRLRGIANLELKISAQPCAANQFGMHNPQFEFCNFLPHHADAPFRLTARF